jgi:hypothetical protein
MCRNLCNFRSVRHLDLRSIFGQVDLGDVQAGQCHSGQRAVGVGLHHLEIIEFSTRKPAIAIDIKPGPQRRKVIACRRVPFREHIFPDVTDRAVVIGVVEHHATTPDGMNYFGVLSLRSPYGDYTGMVGLCNSHKKQFPIGIAIGSRVFVCDNLAFNADHVIKRKHTANAKRDLSGLVAEVIEPLGEARKAQTLQFERYKALPLHDELADQGIMTMYRKGIINLTPIGDILKAYEEPPHD